MRPVEFLSRRIFKGISYRSPSPGSGEQVCLNAEGWMRRPLNTVSTPEPFIFPTEVSWKRLALSSSLASQHDGCASLTAIRPADRIWALNPRLTDAQSMEPSQWSLLNHCTKEGSISIWEVKINCLFQNYSHLSGWQKFLTVWCHFLLVRVQGKQAFSCYQYGTN